MCFLFSMQLKLQAQVEHGILRTTPEELSQGFNLDGSWKFYWRTTINQYQSGLVGLPQEIDVPGNWSQHGLPDTGYGLFVLQIMGPQMNGQELAVIVESISNNYRIYADGVLLNEVGKFDSIPAQSQGDYHPEVVRFTPASDTVELAIEISNYHYREGGINFSIRLGTLQTIAAQFHSGMILDSFITGALLLMFFYFLAYYVIRPSDTTALWFSLLCLVAAFRIITTGEIIIRQLDICIPWEWMFKIELISIILIPLFGGLYLYRLLEQYQYRKIVVFTTILTILVALGAFFLNSYYASYIIPFFRFYALAQLLFLLYMVGRSAIFKTSPWARLAGVGFAFVFVFGVNDILYSKGIIHTQYLLPVGILVYVFIQAIVLTKKFAGSFNEVEQLSSKLQAINRSQEHIIDQRTAELENYNAIKSKIFTIISHDLRSPIATLSSVLSLAEESDDKTVGELRTYFKGIKRSVDNLNLTIENLLSWSQSQINGITINATVVDLNKEVDSVISLYSLVALQKEISLMHKINAHFEVQFDKAHLNLILRNIISNSLKFTNLSGSITLTASEPEAGFVKLCISDNGIGIHHEKVDQLFNPMVHYTSYGTMNEKGTGLGLMLCKEYIERNGGRITIESSIGMGTKVCLWLPKVSQ